MEQRRQEEEGSLHPLVRRMKIQHDYMELVVKVQVQVVVTVMEVVAAVMVVHACYCSS